MNTEDKYQQAKRRVREIRRFYIHLVVYVLVNALLFLINITVSPSDLWFFWPLLGWGIGFVAHATYVFGFGHWLGPDWEEKKFRRPWIAAKDLFTSYYSLGVSGSDDHEPVRT